MRSTGRQRADARIPLSIKEGDSSDGCFQSLGSKGTVVLPAEYRGAELSHKCRGDNPMTQVARVRSSVCTEVEVLVLLCYQKDISN